MTKVEKFIVIALMIMSNFVVTPFLSILCIYLDREGPEWTLLNGELHPSIKLTACIFCIAWFLLSVAFSRIVDEL